MTRCNAFSKKIRDLSLIFVYTMIRGVFITTSESERAIAVGLTLLKSLLGETAFNSRGKLAQHHNSVKNIICNQFFFWILCTHNPITFSNRSVTFYCRKYFILDTALGSLDNE